MKELIQHSIREKRDTHDELIFDINPLPYGASATVSFVEGLATRLIAVEDGKSKPLFSSTKPVPFHAVGSFHVRAAELERVIVHVPPGQTVLVAVEYEISSSDD